MRFFPMWMNMRIWRFLICLFFTYLLSVWIPFWIAATKLPLIWKRNGSVNLWKISQSFFNIWTGNLRFKKLCWITPIPDWYPQLQNLSAETLQIVTVCAARHPQDYLAVLGVTVNSTNTLQKTFSKSFGAPELLWNRVLTLAELLPLHALVVRRY